MSAPAAQANVSAASGPRLHADASAPANASPAPVVSTASTEGAATRSCSPPGPRLARAVGAESRDHVLHPGEGVLAELSLLGFVHDEDVHRIDEAVGQ